MENVKIHPTAQVETDDVGCGTRIWAFCHILHGVHIGANCNIGDHCYIETGASVGDDVTIKNGNLLWEGVTLESGVFVGPNVIFTNDRYPRSPRMPQARRRYESHEWLLPTRVKMGATLGAGAIILPGLMIGEFALVGAGAVVTRNVPPYALVVGNPAQLRGWVCQCGHPLEFSDAYATCLECGLAYELEDDHIRVAVPARERVPVT